MRLLAHALRLLPLFALASCGTPKSPSSSLQAAAAGILSAKFMATCANCHGAHGEGGYGPALAGVSYKDFVAAVRNGKNGVMPVFNLTVYPEAALKSDYTALTKKPVP